MRIINTLCISKGKAVRHCIDLIVKVFDQPKLECLWIKEKRVLGVRNIDFFIGRHK